MAFIHKKRSFWSLMRANNPRDREWRRFA